MTYMTVPEYLPYWQDHFNGNKNGAYMVTVLQDIIDRQCTSLDDVVDFYAMKKMQSSTIVEQGYWWSALGYLQMINKAYGDKKTPQELDWG